MTWPGCTRDKNTGSDDEPHSGEEEEGKQETSGHRDVGGRHTCVLFLLLLCLLLLLNVCRSQQKHRHRGVIRFDADCKISTKLSSSPFSGEASLSRLIALLI